jgi:hypothetical protein
MQDVVLDAGAGALLRPFAWLKKILAQGSNGDQALAILCRHIRPGDNAPELLRRLAADTLPAPTFVARGATLDERPDGGAVGQGSTSSPMLWTRRGSARAKPIPCKFG